MKFLYVISLSLFISVKSSTARAQDGIFQENAKTINVKSPTAAQDGTFYKNAKTNVNSSTATENGTFHENAKRNGNAGLSVVLKNDVKQESQLTRFRRSLYATINTLPCYKHYFVGGIPPTDSITNPRYICQGECPIPGTRDKGCFSTLYDLTEGIPIYSAYALRPVDWGNLGKGTRLDQSWRKQKGFDASITALNENIDSMYRNTGIHKGHLVPAEIYSFSDDNIRSTFVYTNAVPQYQMFNSGEWSVYEGRIRNYGSNTCAGIHGGNLYLLTGISAHRIGMKKTGGIYDMGIQPQRQMSQNPKIAIPNSMWTAGCCVLGQQVLGSFAVIGNNDRIKSNLLTSEVNVQELEGIIGITLFPGNNGCRTHLNT